MKPKNPWRGSKGLWQTAGLMLTIDGQQYLRFERKVQENWGAKHSIGAERGEAGQTSGIKLAKSVWLPTEPLSLRLTRRGDVIAAALQAGSGEWQPLGETTLLAWPKKLRVGVHATNTTGNPFTARFESLAIAQP